MCVLLCEKYVCMYVCINLFSCETVCVYFGMLCMHVCNLFLTAIPIIIEGHETAFNGSWYQFTTGKPLQNVQLTINYYGNGSTRLYVYVVFYDVHICRENVG